MKQICYFFFGMSVLSACSGGTNLFMSGAPLYVCSEPSDTGIIHPDEEIGLDECSDAFSIGRLTDSLLIMSVDNPDFDYRLFDLSSNKSPLLLMPKGNGPNEDVSYRLSQIRNVDGVLLMDFIAANLNSLLSVDLIQSLETGKTQVLCSYPLPDGFPLRSFIVGDSIYSYVALDSDYISVKVQNAGDSAIVRTVPVFGHSSYLWSNWNLFQGSVLLKPDGTGMAFIMGNFEKIHFYDIKGENHFSVTTDADCESEEEIVKKSIRTGTRPPDTYRSACQTDDYIYALHYTHDGRQEIQVFDWEGTCQKCYSFDEDLRSIAVDSADSIMYGMSDDCTKLFVYHLK